MENAIRWGGARVVTVGVVVVLLAAWRSSGGGERRGQPENGTAQDAWIDTVPLLTIGDESSDPLHRVSGAVLVGDTLIIAQSTSLRFYDRRSGEFHIPDTPPDPVRISQEDRRRFSGLDDIDRDDLPRFYPFYSRGSAVVGDAFWVLDYLDRERDHRMEWTVYSQEGESLGRVTAEERLKILAVDGDVAVVVHYGGWNVETVQLRRIVNP